MANQREKTGITGNSDANCFPTSLSILDDIKKLVEIERAKQRLNQDEFFNNLKRWWCQYYKRPYKDPLLEEYSLEELYYEYCDVNYVSEQDEEDNVATELPQEEWDWAAEEEAREAREAAEQIGAEGENDTIVNEEELSDDAWADRYDCAKINPSASESDEGGDISANFES